MSIAGMRVGLKAATALMDTVLGLKDGSVFQQTHTDLATQLMSAGPLANLLATTAGNVVFFATKDLMDANIDYVAPKAAWVFADPDPDQNGSYYFTNGDPGFWTFMTGFPNSWLFATVSGGTANAIELATPASASTSTMIFFVATADCAAGGVTVSINGGDVLDLLDVRGAQLLEGAIVNGGLVAFFPTGDGAARSVIDTTATAAAAAAAASAIAAGTSAGNASDSAGAAADSATLAGKYAQNPEDEEVSPGSGLYSAFHWAQKAASVVLGGIAGAIVAATAKVTPVAADIFTYVDAATGELRKFTWNDARTALAATFVKLTGTTVQALTGGFSQSVVTLTPVAGVLTLDFSLGNHFKATLVANTSLVVANLPAAGTRQEFTLDIIQDATGGRTLSYASAFKWPGRTAAPSITTTANAANTLTGFANSTDVVTVFAGAR